MGTTPKRAFGRSLSDFEPLSVVEKELVECCRIGVFCAVGNGRRPEFPTRSNSLRAELIRFLALGGDDDSPIHENGIQLFGAWIEGVLDLAGCICSSHIFIHKSIFNGNIVALDCRAKTFSLAGSQIQGLVGDRSTFDGVVFFNDGFNSTEEIRLLGAVIADSLDCSSGSFNPGGKHALSLDGSKIGGSVYFNLNFMTSGEVRLSGCTIGGNISCGGGRFFRPEGNAFNLDGVRVQGCVFLDKGFLATSHVKMIGAEVFESIECTASEFRSTDSFTFTIDRTSVRGNLHFGAGFIARGPISLSGARVGALIDEATSGIDEIILDGFKYGTFAGLAPIDSATRILWLEKQPIDHLGKEFRAQPWEQLIKVLREMGHEDDADKVAIAKQDALHRAGKITGLYAWWHQFYGIVAGYGYRPFRTMVTMLFVWFIASIFYLWAGDFGMMGPSSSVIQSNAQIAQVCNVSQGERETMWTVCDKLPQTYTTYNAFWYSLDLILPLVDLQQDKDWSPIVSRPNGDIIWSGVLVRTVMQFEILFGWFASLLLVAVLGNLVKKD